MNWEGLRDLQARLRTSVIALIRPHASITDPEGRWQARFFNGLLFPLAGLTMVGAVFMATRSKSVPWAHILSVALMFAGFALGRTKHIGLAGILAVLGFAEPSFWMVIEKRITAPREVADAMIWLAEALVFSVLAVSLRRSILMNGLLLCAMATLAAILPPHPEMRLAPPLSFLWVFFLLTAMTSVIYHRTRSGFFAQMKERERAEQLALRNGETLGAVVSSSPAAVLMLNLDGLTELWNPAAEKLFGWRAEEVLGKPNPVLLQGQEFDSQRPFGVTRQSRQLLVRELEVPTKSAGTVVVNLSTASVLDTDGAPVGVVGVAVDVTDQRQLEAQLRHAQKMEAVGRLAGGVAHDFNNLLTIINGNAEVVRNELNENHPSYPMIAEILDAGYRAVTLTRQLLAFSRKQPLHKERLDLREVVDSMTQMVRRLIGPNIELEHRDTKDLWTVEADRGQIEQILLNLVVNASDAMPTGGKLTIACANGRYDPRNLLGESSRVIPRAVILTVSDTGQGMSPEVVERIFEPFFTTKDVGKGTGLGLSTVYGIVTNAGAAIEVDSEIGKGTTFRIYWPASEVRSKPEPLAPAPNRGSGELVVVVDDMGSVRALVGRLLERLGYRSILAANAEEAILLCEENAENLSAAIVDLFMPGTNGPACGRKLGERCPGLPILYMTGMADYAVGILSDADTRYPLLEKPFGLRQLGEALSRIKDSRTNARLAGQ